MTTVFAAPTAEPPVDPDRYVDPGIVGPGLVGFILFVALGVATYFLWRSMNKQLDRIDIPDDPQARPVNAPFTRADVVAAPTAGVESAGDPARKGPGSPV
ncbi:MAG: hypothetical protein U0R64_06930 [Candidatus Nanopelagicales bacterium]